MKLQSLLLFNGNENFLSNGNENHFLIFHPKVFRVDKSEMDWMIKRAGIDAARNMPEAIVKLQGLPFGCSKEEISQFFAGEILTIIRSYSYIELYF